MLRRLPSAFFAGLRLGEFGERNVVIRVRYQWFNQNPFRSMYFAIQSMAAEMSTGLLGFAQVYGRDPSVSMLVTAIEGKFYKKATGRVAFNCKYGEAVEKAIEETIATGEGTTVTCVSVGTNEAGEVVSEFWVKWGFRVREVKSSL
ncbi:MAG: DUF4442 domain-containing protein [Sediminibacterium sp.]